MINVLVWFLIAIACLVVSMLIAFWIVDKGYVTNRCSGNCEQGRDCECKGNDK